MGEILANNKALVTKGVAYVIGLGLLWANRKFSVGMTPDDIHSMTAMCAAFIIGVAIHKPAQADGGVK